METTGNVKWFDRKKGYGFIVGPDGRDVFVHYSNIIGDGFRSLRDGESVKYELVETDKGLQANQVTQSNGVASQAGSV
jgi:CspA family cold shock protein